MPGYNNLSSTEKINIRNIQPSDNPVLALIIRNTLAEFGANHPGTVYYDAATDHLFKTFQQSKAHYFVAKLNDEVIGGAGIFPTHALPIDTCELVKMYLLPKARSKGIGKLLIEKCLQTAKDLSFKKVYLESMPELKLALKIYEKFGFEYLNAPMGNTGHFGCGLWMLKN